MSIGHFGVALAAKRVAPKTSLGTLILAAQFLDFLWPVFVLLGIEHVRIARPERPEFPRLISLTIPSRTVFGWQRYGLSSSAVSTTHDAVTRAVPW
jgi:hypothetical protein